MTPATSKADRLANVEAWRRGQVERLVEAEELGDRRSANDARACIAQAQQHLLKILRGAA